VGDAGEELELLLAEVLRQELHPETSVSKSSRMIRNAF
jgi:hypothetical protein